MKKHLILASAMAFAFTLSAPSAGAQSRETVTTTGPNRELLHGGIWRSACPTSPRSSSRPRAIAPRTSTFTSRSPPLDGSRERSGCGNAGEPSCDKETAYKVLLIGNGILQGVGALEILGSPFPGDAHRVGGPKPAARPRHAVLHGSKRLWFGRICAILATSRDRSSIATRAVPAAISPPAIGSPLTS